MENDAAPPTVYIVAGPNGAGKTTFAIDFLPGFAQCREFLNADLIAAGLAPFAPESQNLLAGRLMLERMKALIGERRSFGFETTLAGRTHANLLSKMRSEGYRIELFFLWLPSKELASRRVANRVRQGGHDIPLEDIHRRYRAGVTNLFLLYRPLLDCWRLFDASWLPPRLIFVEELGQQALIAKPLYERIVRQAEAGNDEHDG